MTAAVYRILHRPSGKCYIGSSRNIKRRLAHHQYCLKVGRHHSIKLQRAWNKHGAGEFEFAVLLYCAESDRLDYEQRLIDGFGAASHGYNVSPKAGIPAVGKFSPQRLAQHVALRRSAAKKYDWNGQLLCLSEIAEATGVKLKLLKTRLAEGWSLERAVASPLQAQRRTHAAFGREQGLREWANELGGNVFTLHRAVQRGESIEEYARKQKRITFAEVANLLGVRDSAAEGRIKRGWSLSEALTTPRGAARGSERTFNHI